MTNRPIRFLHRDRVVAVDGLPVTTTVLDWLRGPAGCTGTKEGCAEGDCGACTVLVADLAPDALPARDGVGVAPADHGDPVPPAPRSGVIGGVRLRPVNACMRLLPTLDGKALFTVEDLAALAGGALHPVQQAMVDAHGAQCGFCTPGIVMTLFARYVMAGGQARPDRQELADDLAGNLCRCTGYRPILAAGARMVDAPPALPDLAALRTRLQALARERTATDGDTGFRYAAPDPAFGGRIATFVAPRTAAALAARRVAAEGARLLAGTTDIGVWLNKQFRDVGDLLYVGEVADLATAVRRPDGVLVIGAAVSLEDGWSALATDHPELTELWRRFASPPVRHAGTLVGNLANGSPIGDGAPALIALGATLRLRRGQTVRRLPLQDFYLDYMKNALAAGEFVEAVEVPPRPPRLLLRAYKVSKRFDSDISAVCGVLALRLDGPAAAPRVAEARLVFGGLAGIVRRATGAEQALHGQPWDARAVRAAMAALQADFTPLTDLRASAAYRRDTAANLLWRAWLERDDPAPTGATRVWALQPEPAETAPGAGTAGAGATTGSDASPAAGAVGRPLPHESAHLHVTGSATYTDDLPELAGTLHAALVLSPAAHGRFAPLDRAAAESLPGVVALLVAGDIPGVNDCGPIQHDDPILADGQVHYVGQPVAAVIAVSRNLARRAAARLARGLQVVPAPATLAARDAHAAGRYVVPPLRLARGDAAAALAAAPMRTEGCLVIGGQEQFYLEGQIAYAVPLEDAAMRVHCSTQHPTEMQHVVAHALGVGAHRVQVECRRMGGGFGGKESQSALFACVAAVAARRLGRPVKLRPDRDDDMIVTGKRHPFEIAWTLGHDAEGRFAGARAELVCNAGFSTDLSPPVMTRALCHFDNAYFLPAVDLHGYCARTNTQSHTAFRGFGGPQGALAIEVALDDIARRLGRDPLDVRRANFYAERAGAGRDTTPYGQVVEDNVIAALVDRLARESRYTERRREIAAANAGDPVVRRGLALTPVKFGISFNVAHYNQAGALVHVYTDGTVLVNHGGTEMGQGLHTKVAQVVAHTLGLPPAQVRVSATDTTKVANTSATAASTGADLNGKAAEDAALKLRARLAEVARAMLGEPPGDGAAARAGTEAAQPLPAPGDVRFADGHVQVGDRALPFARVVAEAYTRRVQLWADGYYATPGLHWDRQTLTGRPFHYFAYGAAVSEVAVDTLTGEARVLRADLLHDVGRSLNPAIDIGQVEGGYIQGLGWLTTEELVWHPGDGRLLTHAPSTYKIPTANDCPPDLRVQLYENANAANSIHRSKAVGEPPLLLAFSAFLAIRDAIASAGDGRTPPPLRAPATPEAILDALRAVREAGRSEGLPVGAVGARSPQGAGAADEAAATPAAPTAVASAAPAAVLATPSAPVAP